MQHPAAGLDPTSAQANDPAAPAALAGVVDRVLFERPETGTACCGYGPSANATSWSSSARCRRRAEAN